MKRVLICIVALCGLVFPLLLNHTFAKDDFAIIPKGEGIDGTEVKEIGKNS